MALPEVPPHIEELRDESWFRDAGSSVTNPHEAEHFVDRVGFASCLADSRRPGPSLYVAVCGRRDAVLPRHIQTDPESSLTWHLKDALLRRGKVYYGTMPRGRAMFIAPRLLPHFHALHGVKKAEERTRLSPGARAILRVLRNEWEMGRVTRDTALREIARGFLTTAHLTVRGELARVVGVSRAEAGRGNRALVAEGFATAVGPGCYALQTQGDAETQRF